MSKIEALLDGYAAALECCADDGIDTEWKRRTRQAVIDYHRKRCPTTGNFAEAVDERDRMVSELSGAHEEIADLRRRLRRLGE